MPGIFALGIITSYEDIKYGKIRNKWVLGSLIYAVLVYGVLIVFLLLQNDINAHYLIELGTNFLFSIAVGFGLWYINVWTAGDGKLFVAYSALLPLSVYVHGYQEWIPSFVLLANIFVIGLVFMVFLIFYKLKTRYIKKACLSIVKDFFSAKEIFKSIVSLFAIFWIIDILFKLTGLGSNYILRLFLTMFIFLNIIKWLGKSSVYVMLAITIARLILDKSVYSLSFLIDFLVLIFVWKLIRGFLSGSVSELGKEIFTKEVKVSELKPGMVLSESARRKEAKDILSEAEGLTTEQIVQIRKNDIKKIRISQTIPFAPLMFLGVIITVVAKGNILIFIKNLIYGG